MNFKHIYNILGIILAFNLCGCLSPTVDWEDLESDYDHVLNVFGLISLDPNIDSFVGLYRTTDLDELSQIFVGVDTVGYYEYEEGESEDGEDGFWMIDSLYEPAALIKDATILVTDEQGIEFEFNFIEYDYFHLDTVFYDTTDTTIFGYDIFFIDTIQIDTTFSWRNNYYKDSTGTFDPKPNTTYSLSIIPSNSSDYDPVTGGLTTPGYPVLIDSLIQDTLFVNEPYEIHWQLLENTSGLLTGEVLVEEDEFGLSLNRDWCGGNFERTVDLSEGYYTVPAEFCEETGDTLQPAVSFIRLTAMDDNYFESFITGEIQDYSNLLLNSSTTQGRSVGIEGGYGVFGSIASDGVVRTIVP